MRYVIFFLVLSISLSVRAQNKLHVKNKTFSYEAFFINSKGDTLTNEIIEMSFTDAPWQFQPTTQKDVLITYNTDTAGIKSFIYPFEKVRKKHQKFQAKKESGKRGWEKWTWLNDQEITGYTLNDTVFWIHPPRDNQYKYMELSGMPGMDLVKIRTGETWTEALYLLTGWYDWKGKLVSTYTVTGSYNYTYKKVFAPEAWNIAIEHTHSKLGDYSSEMIFDDKEYGFIRFDNRYHDGNRIIMNLIEIKDTQ